MTDYVYFCVKVRYHVYLCVRVRYHQLCLFIWQGALSPIIFTYVSGCAIMTRCAVTDCLCLSVKVRYDWLCLLLCQGALSPFYLHLWKVTIVFIYVSWCAVTVFVYLCLMVRCPVCCMYFYVLWSSNTWCWHVVASLSWPCCDSSLVFFAKMSFRCCWSFKNCIYWQLQSVWLYWGSFWPPCITCSSVFRSLQ